MRSDEFASELHRKAIEKATTLNLELPKAQRRSTVNAPARFSHGAQSRNVEQLTTDVIWKKSLFEAIDHSVAELQRRFNQEELHRIASTEAILIGSCISTSNAATLASMPLQSLPINVDAPMLQLQLQLLPQLFKDKPLPKDLHQLAAALKDLEPSTCRLFAMVEQVVVLCLSVAISVAGSERSFRALRRLNTWLRSTMSQSRLTHLALMHINKDYLDKIDITALMEEFVAKTRERYLGIFYSNCNCFW